MVCSVHRLSRAVTFVFHQAFLTAPISASTSVRLIHGANNQEVCCTADMMQSHWFCTLSQNWHSYTVCMWWHKINVMTQWFPWFECTVVVQVRELDQMSGWYNLGFISFFFTNTLYYRLCHVHFQWKLKVHYVTFYSIVLVIFDTTWQ